KQIPKEFFLAIQRWVSSDKSGEYKESWQQFKTRCISALQQIITQTLADKKMSAASTKSKDILVFTSGGPISVIIQHILQLSDQQTLMINQQLRNTSVTKLLFSEKMLNVDYINNYSHLELAGVEWLTFR
ncbi:MAG: histidine phosphatase family protein, partial [Gammaproteobacteria bacterium]|nr:histidine phosphatase family protein [Gammaproteobacteria bacterium]